MKWLPKFKWTSVGHRLFLLCFVGISVSIAIMGYYFYDRSTRIIQDKVGYITQQTIQQSGERLDLIMEEYSTRSFYLLGSKKLQQGIKDDFTDNYDREETNKEIGEFIANLLNSKNDLVNLYIFGEYANSYKYSTGYLSMPGTTQAVRSAQWYKEVVAGQGKVVWFGMRPSLVPKPWGDDRWQGPVFCFGRAIKDLNNLNRIIGVMLIEIDPATILSQINLGEVGSSMIVDGRGRIVGGQRPDQLLETIPFRLPTQTSSIGSRTIDNERMMVTHTQLMNGWNLVGLVPARKLVQESRVLGWFTLYLAAGFMAVALGYALFAAWQMNKPVQRLLKGMQEARNGNFEIQIHADRKDEFGLLSRGFNTMIARIKELIDELYVQRLLQQELQLKMFASQINAHFLYNTLDSIHWISKLYKVKEIDTMIYSLSSYFRISLSEGREFVKVGEVMALLEHYFEIQQIRFGDRISLAMSADPELLDCMVLKFAFQPIVENAIFHGIEKKKGSGKLTVEWKRGEDGLLFRVTDDGVGMRSDKLYEIRQVLQDSESIRAGSNFAMKNIHSLLKLTYGPSYGLEIDSAWGTGTRVTMRLPIVESEQSDKIAHGKNKNDHPYISPERAYNEGVSNNQKGGFI
ncbi:two-component system, sensor histidine kinase YesM [Paenibacillus sp. UNC496MF]|uniref:cache domain-containing sensor histidine kinase n=1 Tax=Paenibacillus sp. UNC496MF TaxID=1502753 RepID=UPI0008E23D2F|nr:sensor histidine kinase [Paenibacillus sp. UNC496MF]SFI38245.1 two-component system, sensor histidine kinase YesM [Paenibacillus sp. UNC496MF]